MSVLADRALGLLEYLHIDAESDEILDALVLALLDPADRLSLVAHGDNATVAWAAITDPGVAPLWALPYAAQWTGGVMPTRQPGESDDAYLARSRDAVVQPRGMRRGSKTALRIAALPYLTGTQTCSIVQRLGGSIWAVGVLVLEDEVPDLDALTDAVNDPEVITAGMKATVSFLGVVAWTVAELEDTYFGMTIADLEGDFTTVHTLEANDPA